MAYEAHEWLTVKQAAEYMQCSQATIYSLVRKRLLRASKITGRRDYRFLKEWLDEWLMTSVTIPVPASQ